MRILVVSDTHRDKFSLREAIIRQPKAELVIHLGDGVDEALEMKRDFPQKMFLMVRGNCDWGSTQPVTGSIEVDGKKIFYTHGHTFNVKYGMYEFLGAAHSQKAQIALYGHTHKPVTEYEHGLHVMNPGTLFGSEGTYGIIDITGAGIVTNIIHI